MSGAARSANKLRKAQVMPMTIAITLKAAADPAIAKKSISLMAMSSVWVGSLQTVSSASDLFPIMLISILKKIRIYAD